MNRYVLIGMVGFGLATSGLVHAQSPASKVAPQKGWHTTLETARAQAQKTGKPMMVIFRCDP